MFHSFRSKLLALISVSIIGTLSIAGTALSLYTIDNYEQSTLNSFVDFFTRAEKRIIDERSELLTDTRNLTNLPPLINSLSLISEYSNPKDYQADIYNPEKAKLADFLLEHAISAGVGEISVYDTRGWLVAFTHNVAKPGAYYLGFEDESAVLHRKSFSALEEGWKNLGKTGSSYQFKLDRSLPLEKPFLSADKMGISLNLRLPIYRLYPDGSQKPVGVISTGTLLGENFLSKVAGDLPGDFALATLDGTTMGKLPDDRLPDLIPEGELFSNWKDTVSTLHESETSYYQALRVPSLGLESYLLIASIEKDALHSEIFNTLLIIIAILIISAVITLPFMILFLQKQVNIPINQLVKFARKLQQGSYDYSHQKPKSRELETLHNTLMSVAQRIQKRETELTQARDELEERVRQRTQELTLSNRNLEQEISQRQQLTQELRRSQTMLEEVIKHIPATIFWKDQNTRYLGANQKFLDYHHMKSLDELIGKTDFDFALSTEEAEFFDAIDRRVLESGQAELGIEGISQDRNGKTIYYEANKIPLKDENNRVIGILGTSTDISERVLFEKKLIEARRKAEAANQAKSEFLSRMSHELRTPLNAILGFAQLLMRSAKRSGDETEIQKVAEILNAGEHLLNLITEILDLSRIESGRMQLHQDNFPVNDICHSVYKLTEKMAEEAGIELAFHYLDEDFIQVRADAVRLRQVLINLVNNSIKYNRKNGRVDVLIEENKDRVLFSVKDTGIGIPSDEIPRLFVPFDRLGAEQSQIEGTGIGLVITRELVQLMGGELQVESTPGEGSLFHFSLPKVESSFTEKTNALTESLRPSGTSNQKNKLHILLVEDNPANARLITGMLESSRQFHLQMAKNAEEGLAMAQEAPPDLILLDIELPDMSGEQLFVLLSKKDNTRHIPVIAISANASQQAIEKCLALGFKKYLTKPLDIDILLEAIEDCL